MGENVLPDGRVGWPKAQTRDEWKALAHKFFLVHAEFAESAENAE
jgi:hypothetical protein